MNESLRQRARELGFDDCRVTSSIPPESAQQFENWLASGQHGDMAYLVRNANKRLDPQQVLPGARSIITLAASYATEPERLPRASEPTAGASSTDRERGVIARYARFSDYHDVIGERLKHLTRFVDGLGGPGTRSLWYIDTGPLLERDLAQRSGLGFIGKHTNLISRGLGNWFFICEIITTLELPHNMPEKNHCGSCTRCIAACPTSAITAPFQLDARRCISYLTIELKGAIPAEFRRAIGNRIYGCDDCLAVCPWNRFAREGSLMKAHQRVELETPNLVELLGLNESQFQRRFAGTPMVRSKRRGLARNVCVALGNIGDSTALPALEKAAADVEPLVAEHASWAIAEIKRRSQGTRT